MKKQRALFDHEVNDVRKQGLRRDLKTQFIHQQNIELKKIMKILSAITIRFH